MKLLIVISLLFVSSCEMNLSNVKLEPNLTTDEVRLNKNIKFDVKVFDKRPYTKFIGYRGFGQHRASIGNDQDLKDLIKKEIINALNEKGFNYYDKANNKINIYLLNLNYKAFRYRKSISINTLFELELLNRNNNIIYHNLYRSELNRSIGSFAPKAIEDERDINNSFQQALQSIIDDQDLIQSLR